MSNDKVEETTFQSYQAHLNESERGLFDQLTTTDDERSLIDNLNELSDSAELKALGERQKVFAQMVVIKWITEKLDPKELLRTQAHFSRPTQSQSDFNEYFVKAINAFAPLNALCDKRNKHPSETIKQEISDELIDSLCEMPLLKEALCQSLLLPHVDSIVSRVSNKADRDALIGKFHSLTSVMPRLTQAVMVQDWLESLVHGKWAQFKSEKFELTFLAQHRFLVDSMIDSEKAVGLVSKLQTVPENYRTATVDVIMAQITDDDQRRRLPDILRSEHGKTFRLGNSFSSIIANATLVKDWLELLTSEEPWKMFAERGINPDLFKEHHVLVELMIEEHKALEIGKQLQSSPLEAPRFPIPKTLVQMADACHVFTFMNDAYNDIGKVVELDQIVEPDQDEEHAIEVKPEVKAASLIDKVAALMYDMSSLFTNTAFAKYMGDLCKRVAAALHQMATQLFNGARVSHQSVFNPVLKPENDSVDKSELERGPA